MIYNVVDFLFSTAIYYLRDYGIIIVLFAIVYSVLGRCVIKMVKLLWKPLKQVNSGMELADKDYEDEDERFSDMWKIIKPVWIYMFISPIGIVALILGYIDMVYSLLRVVKNHMIYLDTTILLPWIDNLQKPDPYFIIPLIVCAIHLVSNLIFKKRVKEGNLNKKDVMITCLLVVLEFILMSLIPTALALYFLVHRCINVGIKTKIEGFYAKSFENSKELELNDDCKT